MKQSRPLERRTIRSVKPDVTGEGKIRGLAIPFETWTTIGSGALSFREKVATGAVTKTFQEGDVVLLDNHDPAKPIARKSAGTLEMHTGADGARFEAVPADTSYARDAVVNILARNYGGMSFGFEVVKEKWAIGDDGVDERTLLEIKAPEISVCTFPAYDSTEVGMRDAYAMGIEARDRYYGSSGTRDAKATHADVYTCGECGATDQYGAYCGNCGEPMRQSAAASDYCTSCGAPLNDNNRSSHQCEQRGGDAPGNGKKPYGNVTYADPGYQTDKKKRYPIDTKKHVKAAWSYINKAKNAGRYTSSQLASIKAKIKSAAKKFGVTINSGDSGRSQWARMDLRNYDPCLGFMETRDDPDGKEVAAMREAVELLAEGDAAAARECLESCLNAFDGDSDNDDETGEDSNGMTAHTNQGGSAVPVRSGVATVAVAAHTLERTSDLIRQLPSTARSAEALTILGEISVAVEPRTLQRAYDLIRELAPTAQSNEALSILEPLLADVETAALESERSKPKPEPSTSAVTRDSDAGRELEREFKALQGTYRS